MLLDLDRFKVVNDKHGRDAGNKVLRFFGEHLKQSFGREDVVARWDGEEFVVGSYGITREQGANQLTRVLETWRQQKFTDANNRTFQVTVRVGIVEYLQDGANLKELYCTAKTMLYQAKAMGQS
jgi:diguanylate cyclase (GGDEF)-like protein